MYEGIERRKHPRVKTQIPIELIAPDGSGAVRGTIMNLSSGGMLAVLFKPVSYFGLDPHVAKFKLNDRDHEFRVNCDVRGNVRVVALEYQAGQELLLPVIRSYIREALMADDSPTGRTTRRVTMPRRDEAITIRRMLKHGRAVGGCDPYLEEPLTATATAGGGGWKAGIVGIARLLGL